MSLIPIILGIVGALLMLYAVLFIESIVTQLVIVMFACGLILPIALIYSGVLE